MSGRIAMSKLLSDGVTAVGAALAGGGVYGALLYHMSFALAAAAFICGLVVMVVGLLWGGQIARRDRG
jgi:hypothetical protein